MRDPRQGGVFPVRREARGVGRGGSPAAAFTLVELIAVIGILALLIAVTVPTLSTTQGANVRTAERQVQAGTFYARQQAVTSRQRIVFCIPYQVVRTNSFVRTNMLYRSYLLFGESTGGVARPSSVVGKVETLPAGVVFTNNFPNWLSYEFRDENDTLLFYGYGFRYASTGTVYWKDADKTYRMIITEGDMPDTGASLPRFRQNGIVTTATVNSVTGRVTLAR